MFRIISTPSVVSLNGRALAVPLKLRIGAATNPVPPLPNSVLWLAKDLGFYAREGLIVDLIHMLGTPQLLTAMYRGDLDVTNVATQEVIRLTATKVIDMRAIHSVDTSLWLLIAARTDVKSVADLRGRSVGVAALGSVDQVGTMQVLSSYRIAPADVRLVAIGSPTQRARALAAGRIDATAISMGTWLTIRNAGGVKVLLDADEVHAAAPLVQKVDAVTLRVLNEKPEYLYRFTTAILKASRYFAGHKNAWIDAMARRRPDLLRTDLADLWERYHASWAVNGLLELDEYQRTADFLYATVDFRDVPRIRIEKWTDTRFVRAALNEMGVYCPDARRRADENRRTNC